MGEAPMMAMRISSMYTTLAAALPDAISRDSQSFPWTTMTRSERQVAREGRYV